MRCPGASPQDERRTDRRRAKTRAALIVAAQRILAERGTTEVAVQAITDEADVGLGSFYNHFTTKAELFQEAVLTLLDDFAARMDDAREGREDPAEQVAIGVRLTCRLAGTQPAVARILVLSGSSFMVADRGLAPLALHDIVVGVEKGRFRVSTPALALALVAGSVLAYLQMRLTGGELTDEHADDLASVLLTALGVPQREATEIARRTLTVVADNG